MSHVLSYPLSIVFNKSMSTGVYPDSFKLADVTPLYKSGSRNESTNYRPISLHITISKILEKLIHKRVYIFLDTNGQIYQSQYRFQTKHSCGHTVQELLGSILKGKEKKQYTAAIFLDLSKAFDSLEHDVLLAKLEWYGIRRLANTWFMSYLSNRKMRVKCQTYEADGLILSEYQPVNYGVLQGSCLGLLLFLVFCNDLPATLTFCNAILFADDTTLYKSHTNLRYLEWCKNEELTQLMDWFTANKLMLNLNKSCCMIFAPNNKIIDGVELGANGTKIPIVKCTKFLGVWLDLELNW